jgi:hypothetical protein
MKVLASKHYSNDDSGGSEGYYPEIDEEIYESTLTSVLDMEEDVEQ